MRFVPICGMEVRDEVFGVFKFSSREPGVFLVSAFIT